MRELLKSWIDDAADATERIRGDVAHLREIGRQAKAAAKLATGAAKAKLDKLAAYAAAQIADAEALRGTRGRSR